MKKRNVVLSALCLASLICFTGCKGQGTSLSRTENTNASQTQQQSDIGQPIAKDSDLVVAIPADLETTDPTWESSGTARSLYNNIFERLLEFDQDGNLKPMLAISYEQKSDDQWEFYLRDTARFSDGTPVTAEDVAYMIERCKSETSRLKTYVSTIAQVQILAEDHIMIRTSTPDLILPNRLANVFIISKASGQAFDRKEIIGPMGSGPYRYESRNVNTETVLARNDQCDNKSPKISRLIYRVVPETATRIAELQTGNVDLVSGLTPDLVSVLEADANVTVYAKEGVRSRILYYPFNFSVDSPTSDVRVRQAINYAVDVDAIIRDIFLGNAQRLTQPVDKTSVGYNVDLEAYPYDPEKAKALLLEAGYEEGECKIQFTTTSGKYFCDIEVAQAIVAYLEAVGIKVELSVMEYATYWTKLVKKQLPGMFVATCGNYFNDADNVLGLWFAGGTRGGYSTDETEALIKKERESTSVKERTEILEQLMKLYHDEAAWLFMVDYYDVYATSSKLKGWTPMAGELLNFDEAYFVE